MNALEKMINEAKTENFKNWEVAKINSSDYLATVEGKKGAKIVLTKSGNELVQY